MRAAVLFLALAAAARAAEVPAGPSLTLPEAFAAAKAQSEALAASQAGVEEAEQRVRELWGAVQPSVAVQGSEFLQDSMGGGAGVQSTLNRPDRPEAKLTLAQPLFSGFREFLALKAARTRRDASAADLERASSLLYRDVARAFHDLLSVQHELATRRATVVLTAERVKDLEARAKLGRSRASEVLQAKVLQSEAEAQLPDAAGRERTTHEVLSFLTGLPGPLTPVEAQAAPAPALEDALRRARGRADVRARRDDLAGTQFLERAARRERWPTASLGGNYYLKRIGFQEDIKWDVTFLASLPLYSGGGATARIAEAGSRTRAAELKLKGAERLAESEARRSYARLEAELERGRALASAAELAERNAKAQAEEYKLGVVTNLDVLGSLTSLQNVRLELERSRLEASYLRAELEAAVGGPEAPR
ncbi:TolC family protein [bacterium]|nr:MAG: TolC family protein [bacterium]